MLETEERTEEWLMSDISSKLDAKQFGQLFFRLKCLNIFDLFTYHKALVGFIFVFN